MTTTIEEKTHALGRKGQAAVRELRKLRAERDELDIKIKRHEDTIKAEIGDPPLGEKIFATVGGFKVAYWRSGIRRNVNMALLRKRSPELVGELTTETEVREFKMIGEK